MKFESEQQLWELLCLGRGQGLFDHLSPATKTFERLVDSSESKHDHTFMLFGSLAHFNSFYTAVQKFFKIKHRKENAMFSSDFSKY